MSRLSFMLSSFFLQATQEQQGLQEAVEGIAEDVKLAEMLQVCKPNSDPL